jgi:hypothetical protein
MTRSEKIAPILPGLMVTTTVESVATDGHQIATAQELSRPLKAELVGYLGLLAGVGVRARSDTRSPEEVSDGQ